jgi:peptide/nickel transport system substrate-binding protein
MRGRKFTWLILLSASLAVAVLAGCGNAAQPATETPADNKVITMNFTQEFDSLNPLYTNMYFSTISFQFWLVRPWQYDDKNEPYPVMVTELPTASEDGKVVTIKLRDDIKWSDGEPITADDFIFTYQMYIDPGNTVTSVYPYDQIDSVEAPDAQTVVITFKEPFVPWMSTLFQYGIIPEHILRPVFDTDGTLDNAEWNRNPTVGAGPYVFKEWVSADHALFVRSDTYWGDPAKIDQIFVRFVTDNEAQRAAIIAGDIDVATFLDFSEVPELEKAEVPVYTSLSGYNDGLFFSFYEKANPAVQDLKVRQAIAMGIDRSAITEDLLNGVVKPANSFWANTPYEAPDLKPWPYDPDQAKSLLDEAGWVDSNNDGTRDKDGTELVLNFGTNQRDIRKQVQQVVQQDLAEIGVGIKLFNYESDVFFGTYADKGPQFTGDLDIFEYSDHPVWPDPDAYFWLCSEIASDEKPAGVNSQYLCDKDLDALFQAEAKEVDSQKRTEIFWDISNMMNEKVYWLGLWPDPDLFAVRSSVTGVKFSGVTPFFNITEWDITQ